MASPFPWGFLIPKDGSLGATLTKCVENKVYLGRSEACGLIVLDSNVSKKHCVISKTGDEIYIEDRSTNGTWLNQRRLKKGILCLLHDGDVIRLAVARSKASAAPAFIFYAHDAASESDDVEDEAQTQPIRKQFRLLDVLGRGAFAEVRRAKRYADGKEFAVKIMRKRIGSYDQNALLQEVSIMKRLSHPHILSVEDVFIGAKRLYVVLEYVSGGDLFDCVVRKAREKNDAGKQGCFDEADAKRLFYRLLHAVEYLHCRNFVHRDLKPENVMISSTDHTNIKLGDFGVARCVQNEQARTFCGSPQYFAPEVVERRDTLLGVGTYGKPADIWSCGIILYILIAGHPPFPESMVMLSGSTSLVPDFSEQVWSAVSDSVKDLILKLLDTNPSTRVTALEALNHPWFACEKNLLSGRAATEVFEMSTQPNSEAMMELESDAPVSVDCAEEGAICPQPPLKRRRTAIEEEETPSRYALRKRREKQ